MYKSLLTYTKGESVVLRPLYCIIDKINYILVIVYLEAN